MRRGHSHSHAVVVPWPGQGHINPMMHFSRWLVAHTCFSITFVNTQYNHDRLITSWEKAKKGTEEEKRIRLMAIPDGLPDDMPRSVYNIFSGMVEHMGAHFEALLSKLIKEEEVTCVIADVLACFVPDVGAQYGIPKIGFWTAGASAYACYLAVARGFVPPLDTKCNISKYIKGIPGVLPMQSSDFPIIVRVLNPQYFLINLVIKQFNRLKEASCIVMNTSMVLEADCLGNLFKEGTNMFFLGPTLPLQYLQESSHHHAPHLASIGTSIWEEDASCLAWLDKHAPRSVLYISFGSIAILTMEQIVEFTMGLEASHVPVLWVIRPDLVMGDSSILPKAFVERMGDCLHLVSWAPQLEVLSHKSVGGFLTHCGWNSTLESVIKKVPMLCWPCFGDQPLDRRMIVDLWQVGLEFVANENDIITREEMESKVKALMHGEEGKKIKMRINSLGEFAMKSVFEENGYSRLEFKRFLKLINGFGTSQKGDQF